jgi:hypothetical protein
MKRALLLAGLVLNLLHSSIASAQEVRTDWAPLTKSLTVLLNEGWRIISYSNSKAVTYTKQTDQTNILTELYSFVLAKESKVVICLIYDPQPNNAASRCRALN